MSPIRSFPFAATAVLSLDAALTITHACAADSACNSVYDARVTLAATASHEFMHSTATFRDDASDGEVITGSDAIDVKAGSAWRKRPYDAGHAERNPQAAGSAINVKQDGKKTSRDMNALARDRGGSITAVGKTGQVNTGRWPSESRSCVCRAE